MRHPSLAVPIPACACTRADDRQPCCVRECEESRCDDAHHGRGHDQLRVFADRRVGSTICWHATDSRVRARNAGRDADNESGCDRHQAGCCEGAVHRQLVRVSRAWEVLRLDAVPSPDHSWHLRVAVWGSDRVRWWRARLPVRRREPHRGCLSRGHRRDGQRGPGTNGSQFFLVYKDTTLAPNYTPFGTITGGLAVIQKIAAAGSDNSNGHGDGKPNLRVEITGVDGRDELASVAETSVAVMSPVISVRPRCRSARRARR